MPDALPCRRALIIALSVSLTAAAFAATPDDEQAASDGAAATVDPVTPEQMRASIREYFGGPSPDEALDPDPQILEKIDEGDHERWVLKYTVDTDEYGHAYLLMPKPLPTADDPRPLVLCPHPTSDIGKDRVTGIYAEPPANANEERSRRARQYALDLVRRGFIAFAPDRAAYGDRRLLPHDQGYQEQMKAYREYLSERYPGGFKLTSGKAVWDLQRALDFLVEYDFVDADNIGTIGHSLGAWDSIMLIAMDDRVKAAAVNAGGSLAYRPALWQDPQALRDYVDSPKKQSLSVNTNLYIMLTAPRPLLYLWSVQDTYDRGGPNFVEALRDINAWYESVSGTTRHPEQADFTLLQHPYGHGFPPESQALAYTWLEIRLGLYEE